MSTEVVEQAPEFAQDVMATLARFDARGTSEAKLCAIFTCEAGDLAEARKSDEYKVAYAAEVLKVEARNADLDDNWDDVEARTLGDLREYVQVGGVADPAVMLRIAQTANKMGRRSETRTPDGLQRKAVAEQATLDANPSAVIRLRTRVVERLSEEDGHARIVEREASVVTQSAGKMEETMTADQMHAHIKSALDTDINDQVPSGRAGPDTLLDDIEDLDPAMFAK